MARERRVLITKDGAEALVMPAAVDVWVRHGWTLADDGSSEEETPAPEPEAPAPAKKTTAKKATTRKKAE